MDCQTARPYAKLFGMAPTSTTASRTRLLIEAHLKGTKLDALVQEQRAAGSSWHTIAVLVATKTGVTVTSETLRNWYGPKAAEQLAS